MPADYVCDGVRWASVKVLGKGSFGEAVLVQNGGRNAVVKIVNTAAMSSAERREAQKEVAVLSRLRHPNIVAFIGSSEAEGALHIFMEYCNGGDLERLVKRQKGVHLSEETIASLFLQSASALAYLHARRIMHRDLKSQNLFLSQPSPSSPLLVKLGDFGISTTLKHTMALAKTICGTPYYFSPELCLNRPYNSKSDVWSLGVILFEMACLRYPFDSNSMKGLMQRILQGRWGELPPQYSPAMTSLVGAMLEQKVDRRYDIGKVLASPFAKQHAERMQTQFNLAASRPNNATQSASANQGSKGAPSGAAKESGVVHVANTDRGGGVDPRVPEGSTPPVGDGNAVIFRPMPGLSPGRGIPTDAKQQKAMLRRVALERQAAQKREAQDEARRRRNLRAAQQFDQAQNERQRAERMQELERIDDVRRRIEMCSYEDQQRYVQEGWRVVQAAQDRQAERGQWRTNTDEQISEIKRQMEAIEAKMKERRDQRASEAPPLVPSPPRTPPRPPTARELAQAYKNRVSPEAPWNRGREVPVGFTPAAWERQREVERMAREGRVGLDAPPAPHALPTRTEMGRMALGSGRVEALDVAAFLAKEAAKVPPIGGAAAPQEWQEQMRRIREANSSGAVDAPPPPPSPPPPPAEEKAPRRSRPPQMFVPVEDIICVVDEEDEYEDGEGAANAYGAMLEGLREAKADINIAEADGQSGAAFGDDGWAAVDEAEEAQIRRLYGAELNQPAEAPSNARSQHGGGPVASHTASAKIPNAVGARVTTPPQPKVRVVKRQPSAGNNNAKPRTPLLPSAHSGSPSRPTPEPPTHCGPTQPRPSSFASQEEKPHSTPAVDPLGAFVLGGKELALRGIGPSSSRAERMAALNAFLCDALGGPRSAKAMRQRLEAVQMADVDEAAAAQMLSDLEASYGSQGPYVDLMLQLIVAEGEVHA